MFDIVKDETGAPIVTIEVTTPIGLLHIMAEVSEEGYGLKLQGLHVQGAIPNSAGWPNLRMIADVIMEEMDLDEIVIDGAIRTTGASPGRQPKRVRFPRRHRP